LSSRTLIADAPLPLTLTEALIPRSQTGGLVRDLLLVAGASLLIAACAQISIPLPWTPVPLTGQTFGVLLTGIVLGRKRGTAAMVLYLAEGAAGLPVFSGGSFGVASFLGPTAGYLFAYPVAAFLVGWLAERGWDRKPLTTALAMLLGSLLILTLGALWLSLLLGGWKVGFAKGFAPFIVGDLIKMAVATALLPTAWKLVRQK